MSEETGQKRINKTIEIFNKQYDEEELCDMERDVSEAVLPLFNEKMKDVPNSLGHYNVIIIWEEE